MDYKVFYRKYRPDSFEKIVGQEYTKKMLQNAIKNNKISHAYIFTGPRGTGKTSTAKIFARAINCENPKNGEACGKCRSCLNFSSTADIIEIDAASNNGVDEIRELINNIKIAPTESKYKIYIIDEVHMMTTSAFNALLLTLEEPPAHVIFIMATTSIESVPITILSRCQRFEFKKLSTKEIQNQINYVCKEENIDITSEASLEIAYISEGGMRDALSLLDQLSSNTNKITIDDILSNYGSISTVFIKELVNNILNNNGKELILKFDQLKESSVDYKIFTKKLIQELVSLAIEVKASMVFSKLSYEQLKNLVFELNDCMIRTNININPYVLIELTCLNYIDSTNLKEISENSKIMEEQSQSVGIADLVCKKELLKDELKEQKQESDESNDQKADEKLIEDNKNDINEYNFVELSNDFNEIKKIRINNCFSGAKKDLLNELKKRWKELSTSPIPDDILNLLIDSEIVAASETNLIITNPLESTVLLINKQITDISDYLCEFFDHEFCFIALTTEEWNAEKTQYIKNVKDGITYHYIEEIKQEKEVENEVDNSSDVLKVAQDIFNHDKIEIV